MASKNKKSKSGMLSVNETIAVNKRARFDYELEETFEAGIMLTGTEVKSLRLGQASIAEAYIGPKDGGIVMFNSHIPEYQQAGRHLQHAPKRERKLLLHKREMDKLLGAVAKSGYTIVPTKLYFNKKGIAKIEIALGKGKKTHDKRDTIKERDWQRDKARLLRDKG